MNNLSERVQGEFESWKEIYEIPSDMEFQVKTLLKLQEEYDQVDAGSNTTRTRESLLGMIQKLHMNMRLKVKDKTKIIKPMYVDCVRTGNGTSGRVIIYYNEDIIIVDNPNYSYEDYASKINFLAGEIGKENIIIFVDTRGYGMGLYDQLFHFKDLAIKPLNHKKYNN